MNKNLPKKYNIFSNVLIKIRSIFLFNNKNNGKQMENRKITKEGFIEQIKIEENTEYEKKMFIKKLNNNPKLLENFSNDRLEIILQYYLDENEKKKELLKKFLT